MSVKRIFFVLFLTVFNFSLLGKEYITDWTGRTMGKASVPDWLEPLFEKNNRKKLNNNFDLEKEDQIYYAEAEAETREEAVQNAETDVRAQYARDKRIESRENGTEAEDIMYPAKIRTKTVQELNGLLKVTDFWQQLESDDGKKYFKAWCVFVVEN